MTVYQPSRASPRVSGIQGTVRVAGREVRYRPDIDGLRAVAVVPVVLYHANFDWLSGGFVGVDVFFVISGFLITSILDREIADGRYSIFEFYRRRILRIFPALSVVVLATIFAGYFFLTPNEYVELSKSAAAVVVFISNIYFWKSVSYFQSGNSFQPLLHTWSLAVEEQYYVFFPVLLRLLSARRSVILGALWLIFVGSLALACFIVPVKPSLAFYLLPTRAWELMLGGLVAIGGLPRLETRTAASAASSIGLALIVAPMIVYTGATPFPGLTALPPTIGAALIIWSGGRGIVGNWLSLRPVVLLGQASYSIYLWHLPLIAFGTYLAGGHLSAVTAIALCSASVALGVFSLFAIEAPFRSRRVNRSRQLAIACSGMLAVAAVSAVVYVANGLPLRLTPYDRSVTDAANDKYRHHAECMTVDRSIVPPERACQLGTANVTPTILLWGDSHAMVTASALEQAARRRHGAFLFAADADCPPGVGFDIDPRFDPGLTSQLSYKYCADYNRRMLQLALRSSAVRTIVLSSRWTNWRIGEPPNPMEAPANLRLRDLDGTAASSSANEQKWERGFLALVNRLLLSRKQVVIVGPVPEPTFDVPHELHIERFGFVTRKHEISFTDYQARHRKILRFFAHMRGIKGVSFIWPADALCQRDHCPIVISGHPMFMDQDHLSLFAAQQTSRLYDRLFDQTVG